MEEVISRRAAEAQREGRNMEGAFSTEGNEDNKGWKRMNLRMA